MRIISCVCKCRHDNAYISLVPRPSWSVEGRSGDETNTYICITVNILDVLFLIKYLIEIEMVEGRRRGKEGEREGIKLERKEEEEEEGEGRS